MAYELNIGQTVRLVLPRETQFDFHGLNKHNGEVFTIAKVKYIKDGQSFKPYFELDGLVSDKGIPYAVLANWMQIIEKVQED